MSLALVVARVREQVAEVTPVRLGAQPFVPHGASGATMDLRTQAAAAPMGLHRHYEVRAGMPQDDGEAAVSTRRQRVIVTVVVAYEWALLSTTEDAEVTIGEDAAAIIDRLWNPNHWDESTTGLMALDAGAATARRLAQADVVMLEIPFTILYH